MTTSPTLLCRVGVHRWDRDRDVEGRCWCRRCAQQGPEDPYIDFSATFPY